MTQLVHVSFVVLKYFSLLRVYMYIYIPIYSVLVFTLDKFCNIPKTNWEYIQVEIYKSSTQQRLDLSILQNILVSPLSFIKKIVLLQ